MKARKGQKNLNNNEIVRKNLFLRQLFISFDKSFFFIFIIYKNRI